MPLWAFPPKPPGTDNSIENKLKAGANEGTLLRKQSFVQDAKNVFGKFQKHFLLSRRRFYVFNICCLRVQTENHLGNIEETLTLNVSRLFPCLRTQVTFWRRRICDSEAKNILLPSRLLTRATLWATSTYTSFHNSAHSIVVIHSTWSWSSRLLNQRTSEKSLQNLPTKWTQTKAALSTNLAGNDVEGCRSQVLFQPNMRVFLQCSVKCFFSNVSSFAPAFIFYQAVLLLKPFTLGKQVQLSKSDGI